MRTYQVVQGSSDPLDVQLLNDGAPFDATGMSISVVLITADGSPAPSVAGRVSWKDATNSIARYKPRPTDLRFSACPYAIRFAVTDGIGDVYMYPRFVQPDQILVGL